ncbi:helix-turn-helix domain-containing protein [Streptomyces sp. NPDC007088]|uniref:helix-turn-helix domain-containing protein n=1 Tax=Streptomyces sp. NPDC007088 TaxID=3364773 RepID=UPI0036CB9FCD
MTYRERPAALPGAVLWTREAGGTPASAPACPVLPDGCMDLLWSEESGLLVAGPDVRAQHPAGTAGAAGTAVRWAGLRFAPGTAPVLLGVPARELLGRRVPLAELWPARRAARLRDRVARAGGPAAGLEAAGLELAAGPGVADPLVAALLAGARAGRPLDRIAERTGTGPRLLHRRAVAAFGYGPRTLTRVLRLQRVLPLLDAGLPLAEAAVRAGYADQPHLGREVKALTGFTPAQLRTLRRPVAAEHA